MATNLIKQLVPSPIQMGRDGISLLAATLIAAFILSRFPSLRQFVLANSVTVTDGGTGKTLF